MSLAALVFFVSFPVGLVVLFVYARRVWHAVGALRRTVDANGERLASATETLAELRPDEGRWPNVG